jgi:hypothetical protein
VTVWVVLVPEQKAPHGIRRAAFLASVGVGPVLRSLASFIRRHSGGVRCDQRTTTPPDDDVVLSAEALRGIEALQQMLLTETMYRRLLERDDEDDHPGEQ